LFRFLRNELEDLDVNRTGEILDDFFESFERTRGMEISTYNREFATRLKRLAEVDCRLPDAALAYLYLKKANLKPSTKRQVLIGAGNVYDYERMKTSLRQLVPKAKELREADAVPPRRHCSHSIHVLETEPEAAAAAEVGEVSDGSDSASGPESELAELEREAEILLTQAKKKRSEAEQARGYFRKPGGKEQEERLRQLKAKLPCTRCKSHGKVVYGHWKDDDACPYKSKGDKTNFMVHVCFGTQMRLREESMRRAVPDTACARSCVGEQWLADFEKFAEGEGMSKPVRVPEREPFRFGPGARIFSAEAVLLPLGLSGRTIYIYIYIYTGVGGAGRCAFAFEPCGFKEHGWDSQPAGVYCEIHLARCGGFPHRHEHRSYDDRHHSFRQQGDASVCREVEAEFVRRPLRGFVSLPDLPCDFARIE
jgi:hypothetical protein